MNISYNINYIDNIDNTNNMNNTNNVNNIGIFDPNGINLNPLNNKEYSDEYRKLSSFWINLPAYEYSSQVINSLDKNDILLIISGTGSGKTVLCPKMALHYNNYKGKIIITLPKKIITKKAAEFAAMTLDVKLGDEVGYQFRGDNLKSKNTILLYSTDGSIISQIKSDPLLRHVDIIIIDEAHERKIQIDVLLYLLKNSIKIRKEKNMKPLKLIIMSATINQEIFQNYYKDFNFDCLFLSGKPNFPIDSIYLHKKLDISNKEYVKEGIKIIINICNNINNSNNNTNNNKFPEGDILFFVCTINECKQITYELSTKITDAFIMPLYSGFDKQFEPYLTDQIKYKELNPLHKRRIFISTNVAESSLTIDGIVYVVDSGLEINVKYNPDKKINIMAKQIITNAQILQRKGRSGRTKPGFCYHLYTLQDHDASQKYPDPEIKRIDIKNLCISLMKLGVKINKNINFNVEDTIKMLTEFIEPPLQTYIVDAFDFNIKYNLINNDMKLDHYGSLIVESKLDIEDGLALIYAHNIDETTFTNVYLIIIICNYLKNGIDDFFNSELDESLLIEKKLLLKKLFKNSLDSEHILLLNLYNHIISDVDNILFNNNFVNNITKIFNTKLQQLLFVYNKFNIKISNIKKISNNDSRSNIIYCFNFGYINNRSFRSKNKFIYNNLTCNITNTTIKFDKYSSIIFYFNVFINGKLNISICSPFLL